MGNSRNDNVTRHFISALLFFSNLIRFFFGWWFIVRPALSRLPQGRAFNFVCPFCHLLQLAGDTGGLFFLSKRQKPLPEYNRQDQGVRKEFVKCVCGGGGGGGGGRLKCNLSK